jgi:hypothetical protein
MDTMEKKILRRITTKTQAHRIRKKDIRELCRVENICYWVNLVRKEWDEHITRMCDNRVVKIERGRRCPGRPRKRWRDYITLPASEDGTSNLSL